MTFFQQLTSQFPELKKKLRMAHLDVKPQDYVKKRFLTSLYMGLGMGILSFFMLDKAEKPLFFVPIIGLIFFMIFFSINIRQVDALIRRREKDIDREVLFAGRFLLIKLNTGQPLINALVEASKSYGVANKYFKEIVREIELGTPLEKALERESYYTPSAKFRKILFQISNALKIGIDVTNFLESILDEIANEQLIEIQRYGKKLNGLTLFYMLIAIVCPSLGVTIFIVIASLIQIQLDTPAFVVLIIFLAIIQMIFMSMFKFIRPDVNI